MGDLLSLVCSPQSPWALLEGSSAEDRFRRQRHPDPQMLKEDFLCSYVRSLQGVDKQVSLVEKDLLKFPKLEELVWVPIKSRGRMPSICRQPSRCGSSTARTSARSVCARALHQAGLQHLGLGHHKLRGPCKACTSPPSPANSEPRLEAEKGESVGFGR